MSFLGAAGGGGIAALEGGGIPCRPGPPGAPRQRAIFAPIAKKTPEEAPKIGRINKYLVRNACVFLDKESILE